MRLAGLLPCALSCLALIPNASADNLSMTDYGPWAVSGPVSAPLTSPTLPAPTPVGSVPITGTASYAGATSGTAVLTPHTGISTSPPVSGVVTGNVALNMNFGTQVVSGSISNLLVGTPQTKATMALPNLTVASGPPFTGISGNAFTATVSTFSNYYPINGSLAGTFVGSAAQGAAGSWNASGLIPEAPTPHSYTDISINANFQAGRR